MKGGGPSIAFLLGGPGKSKDEPDGDEADSDSKDSKYKETSIEEYRSYLETAFPDEDWSDDKRVTAMKQFVMACMG